MSAQLRETILKTCFSRHNTQFAGGEQANNKLDLEKIADIPSLRQQVSELMALLATRHNPDLVVGVPRGANWLASDIADWLHIRKAVLDKNSTTKAVSFADEKDKLKYEEASRIVVVEDVFNKFTNTRRVLALPQIGKRAIAAISIWDRGLADEREPLSVEEQALITLPIPAQLPEDSGLWKYA